MDSSFQLPAVTTIPSFPGLGNDAATEELVITKRFTVGSLLAALRAFSAPGMLLGITSSGFEAQPKGEAAWMTADTPMV